MERASHWDEVEAVLWPQMSKPTQVQRVEPETANKLETRIRELEDSQEKLIAYHLRSMDVRDVETDLYRLEERCRRLVQRQSELRERRDLAWDDLSPELRSALSNDDIPF